MSFHGHFWTIGPVVKAAIHKTKLQPSTEWSTTVPDETRDVTLTGRLSPPTGGDTLFVLVHGLGGSPDGHYVRNVARAIEAAGHDYLRLAVRGADRSGADIYHAGLTADLRATLASPGLAKYGRVAVLGFSMGGHVSLRYAAEGVDPRVCAVGAVCPPLDLEATTVAIDRARFNVYRTSLLGGLKEIYREAYARSPLPTPLDKIAKIDRIREWDALTTVLRFGFADVETYYASMSAGPRLSQIEVPTLLVATHDDPMIPVESLRPYLETASKAVTSVITAKGGHVGYPRSIELGLGSPDPLGLDGQVVRWLADRF